ncbi:MAG: glycoside hydrolase family 31 protein [Sandaracinaceae bacterium]
MHRFTSLALLVCLAGCDGDPPPGTDAGPPEVDAGGSSCDFDPGPPEDIAAPEAYTPRWAFEPWISKDISDRDDSYAFVDGFIERDIPVGVLVLDSPWDSQYTTFVPNPSRYPDFGGMVSDMNDRGVRVVMWVTQMVNRTSYDLETGGDTYRGPAPNYAQGCACGYFVESCKLYSWWKGMGSGVDFLNPDARIWWHRQQDSLLAMGIDGWKLDFGDSYLEEDDPLMTFEGPVPFQTYSEAYYEDYLAYGRHVRGRDFLTMVRPYDVSYDRRGRFHARPEHTPVGWVGDNQRDWVGIVDALDEVFRSVDHGYVVVGSDLGGYLDRVEPGLTEEIPFDLENFQRWTAWSGMMPFFQLHGRANLAPWTVPEDPEGTTGHYRYWATLHHEMVGFWYSLAEEAYASGGTMLHPIGTEAEWAGDYRYVVGEAFLVAPMIASGDARDVPLPAGERWYDWWDPAAAPHDGGTTLTAYDVSDRRRIPVFVREGAIVPVDVESDVTGLGDDQSAGHLTVLAWPGDTESAFVLHEADDSTVTLRAQRLGDGTLRVGTSATSRPLLFRVRADAAPSAVTLDGTPLTMVADAAALGPASSGWFHDAASHWLWIEVEAAAADAVIEAAP